jgi:phytoene dehydrogenase-like protein
MNVDAVVIGGGQNGLVAAAALADAGWDVCLLEGQDHVGGAVRSEEFHPGFISDRFSAFYPLGAGSPIIRSLELERHGLRWTHAPSVLAHIKNPETDRAAVMHRSAEETAAGLAEFSTKDGEQWLRLFEQWQSIRDPLIDALFTTFPPVRPVVRLLRRTGTADALRLARFCALPGRRMGDELFESEEAKLLLAGNAAHADVPAESLGSGAYGWLLAMLGQDVGFPVPVGGAGKLAEALCNRAVSAGAQIFTGDPVEAVLVEGGRAVGVRTAGGRVVRARHAVVADVTAPALFGSLVPHDALPARFHSDMKKFEWDTPTVKVNWAVGGRVPWRAAGAGGAGTVHVGADADGLVRWTADLETHVVPKKPFLLVGQMTTADASRSPEGTESVWAYTHLPRGVWDDASSEELLSRIDEVIEAHAPGFIDQVLHRDVQMPRTLEDNNASLARGAVNGGTAQAHQQLFFRPVPGLGRPETPIRNLYLGSASAHPGGGVHGACGWLAARAALKDAGRLGAVRVKVRTRLMETIYRPERERPSAR